MTAMRALAALLLLQIVFAVVTWWPEDRSAQIAKPLLDLEADALTEIEIARRPEGDGEPSWLRLRRDGSSWLIASADDYPADATKVAALLDRMLALQVRAPIAVTKPSHNALKVGEREYGRRVRLKAGETVRELVVGAAESQSVNVRIEGEDEVYVASGLSEFSLSDVASSYYDRAYVRAPVAEIRSFVLENESGVIAGERSAGGENGASGWTLANAPAGSKADTQKVEALVAQLAHLELVEPAGTEVTAAHGLDGRVRVTWTLAAEDESLIGGYTVGAVDGANAYVKSDASRFVATVSAASVEGLRRAVLADLLAPADAPAADAPLDAGVDAPADPAAAEGAR